MITVRLPADDDFSDFLDDVIRGEHLEGKALGIARLALDEGTRVLSPKQAYVLQKEVIEPYSITKCDRCSNPVPWCEMYWAVQSDGGKCSWCAHMDAKNA